MPADVGLELGIHLDKQGKGFRPFRIFPASGLGSNPGPEDNPIPCETFKGMGEE